MERAIQPCHISGMVKHPKRPRDFSQAAKLVIDKLNVERLYQQLEPGHPSSSDAHAPRGLIEVGLSALMDILAGS